MISFTFGDLAYDKHCVNTEVCEGWYDVALALGACNVNLPGDISFVYVQQVKGIVWF